MNWLASVPLSGEAAAIRRTLSVGEFCAAQRAIEYFALLSDRPLAELAARVLVGVQDMHDAGDGEALAGLVEDVRDEQR